MFITPYFILVADMSDHQKSADLDFKSSKCDVSVNNEDKNSLSDQKSKSRRKIMKIIATGMTIGSIVVSLIVAIKNQFKSYESFQNRL